jgi:hypothetical protein
MHGCVRKPWPAGLARPCLEPELLGATQHFRNTDRLAGELVSNLLRIRSDAAVDFGFNVGLEGSLGIFSVSIETGT